MYFDGIYIFIQNQELKRFGCLYSLYIISSWYILKVTAATFVKNWNNLSRIDIFNKSFFAIVTGNQETQRLSSEKLVVFINKPGRQDNGPGKSEKIFLKTVTAKLWFGGLTFNKCISQPADRIINQPARLWPCVLCLHNKWPLFILAVRRMYIYKWL